MNNKIRSRDSEVNLNKKDEENDKMPRFFTYFLKINKPARIPETRVAITGVLKR